MTLVLLGVEDVLDVDALHHIEPGLCRYDTVGGARLEQRVEMLRWVVPRVLARNDDLSGVTSNIRTRRLHRLPLRPQSDVNFAKSRQRFYAQARLQLVFTSSKLSAEQLGAKAGSWSFLNI